MELYFKSVVELKTIFSGIEIYFNIFIWVEIIWYIYYGIMHKEFMLLETINYDN